MKKLLCNLLLLPILTLVSCSREPPTVQDSFSLHFSVSQDDTDYTGTLNRSDGVMNISMDAPYTVNGVRFTYENGELSIESGTLGTKANCDYLPSGSIPSTLFDAFTYLPQAVYVSSGEGKDAFTLPTPYGDAELFAKDSFPEALNAPYWVWNSILSPYSKRQFAMNCLPSCFLCDRFNE